MKKLGKSKDTPIAINIPVNNEHFSTYIINKKIKSKNDNMLDYVVKRSYAVGSLRIGIGGSSSSYTPPSSARQAKVVDYSVDIYGVARRGSVMKGSKFILKKSEKTKK